MSRVPSGAALDRLSRAMGKALLQSKQTLATAESCTGGLLAHTITHTPGASAYFLGGVVSYSNAAKTDLLGVSKKILARYGAVSAEVAKAMARGVRARFKADFGLATTGIAGPSGGSAHKPVGTVYLAIASRRKVWVAQAYFPGSREAFKRRTVFEILSAQLSLCSEVDSKAKVEAWVSQIWKFHRK